MEKEIFFIIIILILYCIFFKDNNELLYFGSSRCPYSNKRSESYELFKNIKNFSDNEYFDNVKQFKKYKIEYVPTWIFNGKKVENFEEIINDLCPTGDRNCIKNSINM